MKILTMTDSKYFQYGELFVETCHRVNAEIECWHGDKIMHVDEIKWSGMSFVSEKWFQDLFPTQMQLLKFKILALQNGSCWFCDWDTFFLSNPGLFLSDINEPTIGIAKRQDMVSAGCLRAYANGGVIFSHNAKRFWKWAVQVCTNGGSKILPEYDEIWKTLEDEKRPAHKRHFRTNLRWWVDQVFLSSILLKKQRTGQDYVEGVKVIELDERYDMCDVTYEEAEQRGAIIGHLKSKSSAPAEVKDGCRS